MDKCVVNTRFYCAEWPKKTIKDYFKTVDVFTEDLPVQVINAPVIVHTIEPLRQANTEQRQGMVHRTCPTVRPFFWTATT